VSAPAPLTLLASASDVEDQLGRSLTPDEETRATGLLALASSHIRAHTRQDFTAATSTVVLRAAGATVTLPQRPVVSVDELRAIMVDGSTLPVPVWGFDGVDTVDMTGTLDFAGGVGVSTSVIVNLPAGVASWWTETMRVTYTHGYTAPPEDVTQVCAGMVYRLFNAPGSGQVGIASERVYRYYEFQLADGAKSGQVSLTDDDKLLLARYRRKARTVQVR
jgi:hypothetical protein